MTALLPEDFPVMQMGSLIVGSRGALAMAASPELAAEMAAMLNACNMMQSLAVDMPSLDPPGEHDPAVAPEPPADEPGWKLKGKD